MRRLFLAVLLSALAFAVPAFSQQRWERKYGGADNDEGSSVRQTTDTGYIVAGTYDYSGTDPQVYLVKTDADGNSGVEETAGVRD